MKEQKLADELQRESNIDKIRRAVKKVSKQKLIENGTDDELDFDSLGYLGDMH